jgi:vacuolar-type H+-ATPase subunit E/Vma4
VQTDANVQRDRILADGKARLNREQALIEQQALIQALQIHADARQSLIEKVMENVKERLPGLRNTKDYERFLDTLVNEALQSLKPSLLKDKK